MSSANSLDIKNSQNQWMPVWHDAFEETMLLSAMKQSKQGKKN